MPQRIPVAGFAGRMNRPRTVVQRCGCHTPSVNCDYQRLCIGCDTWLDQNSENFYHAGRGSWTSRCKNCFRIRYGGDRRRGTSVRPRERQFGIELEMTAPAGYRIYEAIARHGVPVSDRERYVSTNGARWEVKTDGSVRGEGIEVASPKLRGEAGFAQVRSVCEALAEVEARVDRSCGVHVHVDMRGKTGGEIRDQVLAFLNRQHAINRLVAPSRRRAAHSYCRQWRTEEVEQLRGLRDGVDPRRMQMGPRGTINLWSYTRHGTVEIRQHGGSTHPKKLVAWIKMNMGLFQAALDGEIDQVRGVGTNGDPREMLEDLVRRGSLTAEDAAWLLRFETVGSTRRAVAATMRRLEAEREMAESLVEEVAV